MIPLLIMGGIYDRLDGSAFAEGIESPTNFAVLLSTISLCIPLLLDLLLDVIHHTEAEYLSFRAVSVVSLLISAIVAISYEGSVAKPSVVLAIYIWGYFIEVSVILSLLHDIIPQFMTYWRTLIIGLFFYLSFLIINISSIKACSVLPLQPLYYAFFFGASTLFFGVISLWMKSLWTSYLISKIRLKKTFFRWLKELDNKTLCAFTILGILLPFFVMFFVVIFGLEPQFPRVEDLCDIPRMCLVIGRAALCLFTYILPSRLFRAKLVSGSRDTEIKTEFVKYISHEMRSPLSVLLLSLSEMSDRKNASLRDTSGTVFISSSFDSQPAVSVDDMKATVTSALEILDDLLIYEQIESSTIAMNFKLENPFEVLKTVLKGYKTKLKILRITGSEEFTHRINVDPSKLNVIFNALLHPAMVSKNNDKKVIITFAVGEPAPLNAVTRVMRTASVAPASEKSTGMFNIFIKDTVSNLKLVDMERYLKEDTVRFERVGRVDNSGSGFGIWIAKKLIELHKGLLSIVDTEDGVIFKVGFPLIPPPKIESPMSSHRLVLSVRSTILPRPLERQTRAFMTTPNPLKKMFSNSRLSASEHKSFFAGSSDQKSKDGVEIYPQSESKALSVLIVDDSDMVRKVMLRLMKGMGHTCEEASDGHYGVDAVKESKRKGSPFDIILLDNQMPTMMGHEAARIIREELRYKGLILGVTGNSSEDDVSHFIKQGADQVIIKPLTKAKFENFFASIADRNV